MSLITDTSVDAGRRRVLLLPMFAGALGCAAFLSLHALNFHHGVAPMIHRAARLYPDSPMGGTTVLAEVVWFCIQSAALYVGFSLAGAAIAAKTRDRILWMAPAVLYVLSPLPTMLVLQDRSALRPIVEPFAAGPAPGRLRILFALVDLATVLLPGAVIAMRETGRRARVDGKQWASVAACALLGVVLYLRQQYAANGSFDVNVEAHLTLMLLFGLGVALGVKRPWFPWVHIVVAVCFSEALWITANWIHPVGAQTFSSFEQVRHIGMALLPQLTAVGLGALSDPLARYLRSRRERVAALPQAV